MIWILKTQTETKIKRCWAEILPMLLSLLIFPASVCWHTEISIFTAFRGQDKLQPWKKYTHDRSKPTFSSFFTFFISSCSCSCHANLGKSLSAKWVQSDFGWNLYLLQHLPDTCLSFCQKRCSQQGARWASWKGKAAAAKLTQNTLIAKKKNLQLDLKAKVFQLSRY